MKHSKRLVAWMLTIGIVMVTLSSFIFASELEYTQEELDYIKENPVVRIGVDPEFSPYEFIDNDDTYKGIAADYLKHIEISTGLTFEVVEDKSWSEVYDMAIEGEVDLLPCVGIQEERKKYFTFTKGYIKFQRVLLSREDNKTYSFSSLDGTEVGVQRNSSHSSFVTSELDAQAIFFKNNDELLLALAYGDIESAVTNYASSRYRIKELGLTNIKVDDIYDDSVNELAMAINPSKTELISIINKALSHITEEEAIAIRNKWLGIEQAPDYSTIIRNVVIAVVIALVVFGTFLRWNYRLKKEIKHRKEIEEELVVAKQIADEASEAKGRFLAHMSHEIRTPLNAITGQTYLLENTKISMVQQKYISGIKNASYRLLATINDILDFSKIEAGEVTLESIEFSMDVLLDKVSNLLKQKAVDKELAFHVKTDISIPEALISDPTRIEQILINFVNNAIKFTSNGEISVEVVVVSQREDQCVVKFMVKDTGIGISEVQRDHLFIPFHQLDSSVTRQYGGTGLGLTISQNLAHLLGGNITVVSEKNRGSTFILEVPMKIPVQLDDDGANKQRPDLSGIKTLLVDSDSISREIVAGYLEAYQMEVDQASTLKDAYELIDINHLYYDLVIVGKSSAGISELELIEDLSSTKAHVIMMAENINESEYAIVEALGVKHIIMKPIIASILFDSIVQYFSEAISNTDDQVDYSVDKIQYPHYVLLVEDNEVNQMIEKEILEQKGYLVTVANNGLEAVEIMSENESIEIILMDIHMPIMDGYEATKEIRKFNTQIPILAMTAVTYSDVQKETEAVGMNGYVMKPVEPEQLFIEIEKYVHKDNQPVEVQVEELSIEERLEECVYGDYIDVKQGLSRISNNTELYIKVMKSFKGDLIEGKGLLAGYLNNQQYDEAAKYVHKMKGCAGNVGAVRLFQSSHIMMKAIKDGIEVDLGPYTWEFENDLKETLKIVECMIQEGGLCDVQPVVDLKLNQFTGELEGKLIKLKNLLVASDLDAFKLFEEINEMLPLNKPEWKAVEAAMHRYDFEDATAKLEQIGY